ncbi:MAG: hypothetical protein HP493_15295 [Nitrospira sp.]|nr:hypothetical protein [Nitrospira sp.]
MRSVWRSVTAQLFCRPPARPDGPPDARERFRALSHWEEKGEVKAPLDAVFEAMEDEDEAVRAKATAIVEQRWAAEHNREKS